MKIVASHEYPSCRKNSKNDACKYYSHEKINGTVYSICKLDSRVLSKVEVLEGCNHWQNMTQTELEREKVLTAAISTIKKFKILYPGTTITKLNFGSIAYIMKYKDGTDDNEYVIIGNPEEHEIVPKFPLEPEDTPIGIKQRERIPNLDYFLDKEKLLMEVAYAYKNDLPMALWGHTGCGKSELIKTFAALINAPLYRVNFHGMTTTDDIIGKLLPAGEGKVYFQDGGVTECVRNGGILLMEEFNATSQEIHFALHGLFDNFGSLVLVEKDNEIVPKNSNCRIFATMNPSEYISLYPGTKDLSQAFAGRWPIFRYIDFLPSKEEEKILAKLYPKLDKEIIKQMVKAAKIARQLLYSYKINFVFSLRTLKNWANLTTRFGMMKAAEMTFLGHMDSNSRNIMITEVLDNVTSLDTKELKLKYMRGA